MNRRRFFQRIGAAAIGLTLARHLPGIAPQAPTLAINPDAFEMAMVGLDSPPINGLANRIDVLYGWSTATVPPAPPFTMMEFR